MNKISLIILLFLLLLTLSFVISKKTKNITFSGQTTDELKNIVLKMLELLEKNFICLTMLISIINISQEISDDSDYEEYKKESKLFFEKNEENFIEYRELERKLFAILNETELNNKEYSKICNACSAGSFCFDEMRELFIATSTYFLFKDKKRKNIAIAIASEIHSAHQTSQYLRVFLE